MAPNKELAQHYRHRAELMLRIANLSESPQLRLTYLELASRWRQMALELEDDCPPEAEPDSSTNRPSVQSDDN